MRIDNSGAKLWWRCPLEYQEKYVHEREPETLQGAMAFGTRLHELLEEHYSGKQKYQASEDIGLEAEAQVMFEAYRAYYPEEPFEVVDVERVFEVPLKLDNCGGSGSDEASRLSCPRCKGTGFEAIHTYTGKFDVIVRMRDSGRLWLMDHKTERRNSHSNSPESWASRSQVSLYIWAAEQVYNEPVEGIIVNILRRQSPKGEIGPEFRRDHPQRSKEQIAEAVANITWVADQIERMKREYGERQWPANRNNCIQGNFKCDYFAGHLYGWSDELLRKYVKPKPYLEL